MSVEQRELLMAMHHIQCVVDIQRDRARRPPVAVAVGVNHRVGHAYNLAQRGCVLPARHGGLRAEIDATVRQASAGQLEARIGAQVVKVVGVFVATGDCQHACAQNVGHAVPHQQRIARIGDQRRKPIGDAKLLLDCGEQHYAAIGRDASAVERSGDFLAFDGWETEWQQAIFKHGGCGTVRFGGNWL